MRWYAIYYGGGKAQVVRVAREPRDGDYLDVGFAEGPFKTKQEAVDRVHYMNNKVVGEER